MKLIIKQSLSTQISHTVAVHHITYLYTHHMHRRGVRNVEPNENVGYLFGFLKTKLNQPQNSKTENSVSAV